MTSQFVNKVGIYPEKCFA